MQERKACEKKREIHERRRITGEGGNEKVSLNVSQKSR